ncbi:hypothetical protein FB107DRAFT_280231 [Schizophyllum commune]
MQNDLCMQEDTSQERPPYPGALSSANPRAASASRRGIGGRFFQPGRDPILASYVHHATSSTPVPIRATTSSSLGHISVGHARRLPHFVRVWPTSSLLILPPNILPYSRHSDAASRLYRNNVGIVPSLPPPPRPPCPCCDAAPRSSSDAVAVVSRQHPIRDAQAWETGGCVPGTTARASAGEESGLSLAMPNVPGTDNAGIFCPLDEITDAVEVHDPLQIRHEGVSSNFPPSPTSKHAAFSCEIEPPEARTAALDFDILADPEPPEACTGSPGEISEVFACVEPPEASAGTLEEGYVGGGVPPTLAQVRREVLHKIR